MSGSVIFVLLVGVLTLLFGIGAGTWYVAHQFAWWTYAIFYTVFALTWEFGKASFKAAGDDRRK